jgi:hypothetical protein
LLSPVLNSTDGLLSRARQNRAEKEEMARRIDAMWDRVVEPTLQEGGVAVRQ